VPIGKPYKAYKPTITGGISVKQMQQLQKKIQNNPHNPHNPGNKPHRKIGY